VGDQDPWEIPALYDHAVYLAAAEMARDVLGQSDEPVRRQMANLIIDWDWLAKQPFQVHIAAIERGEYPPYDFMQFAIDAGAKVKKARAAALDQRESKAND
jgi:hypothetical protein